MKTPKKQERKVNERQGKIDKLANTERKEIMNE
jgi:hypothetical protein